MNKIDLIIDALELAIETSEFERVNSAYRQALAAARELKALAQPESQATLYDVCQEVLRLEAVQKELLGALKELLRVEAISDDGEIILEVARHNARAAIAKAEEQA